MFDEAKTSHMAAYFLLKSGGKMPHLKLMKLLYLSDRESLRQYGFSMSDDHPVSMPHGPVLSNTLDLINGEAPNGVWGRMVADKENYEVALKEKNLKAEDLDELSPADISILEEIWRKFGKMDTWEIRNYTHNNCPEWKDPQGSSCPIALFDILRAVGRDEQEAKETVSRIEEQNKIDAFFAS